LKKAFGIITALLILVLVSFLLMLVLKSASVGIHHTNNSYVKEQAELFLRSSIENSILAIEGYERNSSNGCLKHINFMDSNKRFESNTTVLRYYCYDMNKCPNCDIATKIETEDSHGSVLLKTVVQTTSNNTRNISQHVRITRITIQRP
jgi:type II secretory pathway component PulK